jgi:MFS family permease
MLTVHSYAADSLLAFLPSITASNVVAEFSPSYTRAGQLSLYIGLLAGALFWGTSADIIGRKWAFNLSLLITAIFAIVAGGSPNYAAWGAFNALLAFGAGGNLALDTTVFLEYLPHKHGWVITLMAAWWGIGQTMAGFIAWGFLRRFHSCIAGFHSTNRDQQTIAVLLLPPRVPGRTTWAGATSTLLRAHWCWP